MIRIFLNLDKIKPNDILNITDNNLSYLKNVMRVKISDQIIIFNGKDGDFLAKITEIAKKKLTIQVNSRIKEQNQLAKISLAFSIVKNNTLESIAKRGMEMGVTKFIPIVTQRSFMNKFNKEKFYSNVKEGAEQCERNDLAIITELQNLENFLKNYHDDDKILILCDESKNPEKTSHIFNKINVQNREIIIIIGPEGGFSEQELNLIKSKKHLKAISLGERILRVDTAIVSCLALINELLI